MTACRAASHLSPRLEWARHSEAQRNQEGPRSLGAERSNEAVVRLCFVGRGSRGSRHDLTRDITRGAIV